MRGPWLVAALAAFMVAPGCAVGGFNDAGGRTGDGGIRLVDGGRRDGAVRDAAPRDGSVATDARVDGAIRRDGGTTLDAGRRDAGFDAGGGGGMDVPIGQPCGSDGNCVAGAACHAGLCRRICASESDCPGRGSSCFIQRMPAEPASLCTLPCEPTNNAGCPSGFMCLPLHMGGGNWGSECFRAGSVPQGGGCSNHTDCQATMGCYSGTCEVFCNFDGPSSCSFCTFFGSNQPMVEADGYGYCS